jgi:cysteine synthase A
VKHGNLAGVEGDSIAEGIGQTRITGNLAGAVIDDALRIDDAPAVAMAHTLLREEGIFAGLSAAMNVCAAGQLAREGGPGQVIVTVLCDTGARYVSTLFNPAWLAARGLSVCG